MRQNSKILLIAPKILEAKRFPSVGLAYLSSYLCSKGYEVKVVDSNFTDQDPYRALKGIRHQGVVGISCESKNIEEALKIARYAKTKGNILVMGGLHVSLIKEEILKNDYVDYGIHGDGELSFFKFLQFLEGNISLSEVPGLIYRKGAQAIVNSKGQIENLDDLNFPDYRLMGIDKIFDYPLITSRDCPYQCSYCTVGAVSHGKWRARSPKNIIAELKLAKERYSIKRFTVLDENFSYDIERVKTFCASLIKEKFVLPWAILEGVRADKVDKELLKLLKMSGCKNLIYGIESADENVFKNLSKGGSFSDIEKAIRLAQSEGIYVGGYFVIGLPGSTFVSEMKSIRFALRHRLNPIVFWMAIPYYNTRLYKWVLNNARLLREPIGENVVNSLRTEPFFETAIFPRNQVRKAFVIAQEPFRSDYFNFIWGPAKWKIFKKIKDY